MTNKYDPIINIRGNGNPVVAVVGCLHGDEPVGKKVINRLKKEKITSGTLITIIAHPVALKKKKRFIKQDLNRSFFGKKVGKIEERIAYQIMKLIKKSDYVIDIHSTTTDTKNLVIIKKYNAKTKKLLKIINPSKIALFKRNIAEKALINFCPGVSLEYGKHESQSTLKNSLNSVKNVLTSLKMIKGKKPGRKQLSKYYEIYGTIKKPQKFIINNTIKNFNLVKKGQSLGKINNKKVLAQESFYPVLFGKKTYKDILGFKARMLR